jgi:hypothetical protein
MTSPRLALFTAALAVLAVSGPASALINPGVWGNEGDEVDSSGAWWTIANSANASITAGAVLETSYGPDNGGTDGAYLFSGPDTFWDLSSDNGNGEFAMDFRIRASASGPGINKNADIVGPAIELQLPSGTAGSADLAYVFFKFFDARAGTSDPNNPDALTVTVGDNNNLASSQGFQDGLAINWNDFNTLRLYGIREGSNQRLRLYANADSNPLFDQAVSLVNGGNTGGINLGTGQPRQTAGSFSASFDLDFIRLQRDLSGGADDGGLPFDGPPLPEPATLGLLLIGGMTILGRRRRAG